MTNDYARFKSFSETASLWSGEIMGLKQFYLTNFNYDHLVDNDSFELPVIPQGTVLGKRAEHFFKFCIEKSNNYKLLLSNIQIFKGKITIGEFDFLVEDKKTNDTIHIELVYKFYIYQPKIQRTESSDIEQELYKYQGPNGKDNLIRKINHLKNHQLPLLYSKESKNILKSHNIDITSIKQQVCFLAHIFIPHQLWSHSFKYINTNCIVGYYYKISAFAKAETDNIYFLPEKYAWKMTPQVLPTSYSFPNIFELIKQSLERGFAPLIWMYNSDIDSFERFFVVK